MSIDDVAVPQGAGTLIDRDPQHLPVPIGGEAPVHRIRPPRRRLIRRHGPAMLTVLAALAAAAGVALLVLPVRVDAFLDADGIHVGATTLHVARTFAGRPAATGQTMTVYGGGDAWYALVEPGDGSAHAAAIWSAGGTTTMATCDLHRNGQRIVDECSFTIGSSHLTCVDVLAAADGPTWRRTYADGTRVEIDVPPDGAAVPVAFPVGR